MAKIRCKDTKPEMTVRRLVHGMGYRFRLHAKDLPGKPDLVFRKRRAAIFVHGCFWHQHPNCRSSRIPKSNTLYWQAKLERNVDRDAKNIGKLQEQRWRVLTVWECDLSDLESVAATITRFLDPPRPN